MRQCEYTSNGNRCKNWITSKDEEDSLCPLHAGVSKRSQEPLSEKDREAKQRYDDRVAVVQLMDNETLQKHILQLEALIEKIKFDQNIARHEQSKRIKALSENPDKLSAAQKAELEKLRGSKAPSAKREAMSPMEVEIQKLMKKGLSREKAMLILEAE